jgi:hypothetical protein
MTYVVTLTDSAENKLMKDYPDPRKNTNPRKEDTNEHKQEKAG